jgi:hypothetical protein
MPNIHLSEVALVALGLFQTWPYSAKAHSELLFCEPGILPGEASPPVVQSCFRQLPIVELLHTSLASWFTFRGC